MTGRHQRNSRRGYSDSRFAARSSPRLGMKLLGSLLMLCVVLALGYASGSYYARLGDEPLADDRQLVAGRPEQASSASRILGTPRMPAEFESQELLLLGCRELLDSHPELVVAIVAAIERTTRVVAVVGDQEQAAHARALFAQQGLSDKRIEYLVVPLHTLQMRSAGPIFLLDDQGQPCLIESTGRRGEHRPNERRLTETLATRFNVPRVPIPLAIDNGKLLSNGLRSCVSSFALVDNNVERHYDLADISSLLSDYFGFENWSCLTRLADEPRGNVSTFAVYLAADLAVVGRYAPEVDSANAKILDKNAEVLAEVQTAKGPMRVERVDQPPHDDALWRSYTNVLFANGVLLVPQYPSVAPELDRRAIELYQRLLPTWQVVGIDAEPLATQQASLRSISLGVPMFRRGASTGSSH